VRGLDGHQLLTLGYQNEHEHHGKAHD
jgi:hypothetical protein